MYFEKFLHINWGIPEAYNKGSTFLSKYIASALCSLHGWRIQAFLCWHANKFFMKWCFSSSRCYLYTILSCLYEDHSCQMTRYFPNICILRESAANSDILVRQQLHQCLWLKHQAGANFIILYLSSCLYHCICHNTCLTKSCSKGKARENIPARNKHLYDQVLLGPQCYVTCCCTGRRQLMIHLLSHQGREIHLQR